MPAAATWIAFAKGVPVGKGAPVASTQNLWYDVWAAQICALVRHIYREWNKGADDCTDAVSKAGRPHSIFNVHKDTFRPVVFLRRAMDA